MEKEILSDQSFTVASIPAAGLHGVNLFNIPGNLIKLMQGYFKARKLIRDFQPDVTFFTGGFIGIPVSVAAGNTPSVVFIPDIEPGSALKYLIRRSRVITMATEESLNYIQANKKSVVTGYPIRPDLAQWTQSKGIKALRLSNKVPILLVFGGSKGALSINQALYPILPELLRKAQVVHLSGMDNYAEAEKVKANLPREIRPLYHAYPFLHNKMGAALASADLVVCRAGASTLGELPFFGLPAILVPYPHAWRYQRTNAEYLVKHGGAIILENQGLANTFLSEVMNLLEDTKALAHMRHCMGKLAKPDAAKKIGEIIFGVGTMKGDPSL